MLCTSSKYISVVLTTTVRCPEASPAGAARYAVPAAVSRVLWAARAHADRSRRRPFATRVCAYHSGQRPVATNPNGRVACCGALSEDGRNKAALPAPAGDRTRTRSCNKMGDVNAVGRRAMPGTSGRSVRQPMLVRVYGRGGFAGRQAGVRPNHDAPGSLPLSGRVITHRETSVSCGRVTTYGGLAALRPSDGAPGN